MNDVETQGMELANKGGNYSPVHVINNDTVGTLFLGMLALFLLVVFVRAQKRNLELEQVLVRSDRQAIRAS